MRTLLDNLKDYLGNGRWMWVVGGVILVIVILVPGSFLWSAIQPKPAPTYMKVPSGEQPSSAAGPAVLPAVPQDVSEQIANELGATEPGTLSMVYQGDTEHVAVTRAVGPTDFKRYLFVQGEDGIWSQQ